MVGPSSRLLLLLNTPLSLLHHRPSTILRLARRHSLPALSAVHHRLLLPPSRANLLFPIKSSRRFHSQIAGNSPQESNIVPADAYSAPPSHPWPEWSELLGSLSNAGYFVGNSSIEDEFVANESLSMEFVAAASSCLCFARDRPDILGWLPKKDIQVLVEDGTPFLFKNAFETERRMRYFLQGEESNEAKTVDLMKYILSYASNPIIYPERNIREAAESSARTLLREMANLNLTGPASHMSAPEQFQVAGQDEQTPRNLGLNITKKRGDWICPKCSFMNFARNTKCLECEEPRPQRQLTGGEWDCPQCNFFNYRRNVVCLKCECKRPGEAPFPGSFAPSDRQLMNSLNQNNYDNGNPNGNNFRGSNRNLEMSFNPNLNQFHDNSSTVPGTYTTNVDRGQNARRDSRRPIPKGSNSSYVPFVPLPADMFAKKPEKITSSELPLLNVSDLTSAVSASNEPVNVREDSQWSETPATKVESRTKDNEEEKSETWFKKVIELHDVKDSGSGISDEDFPQIMPMRKGENRFVVSKKKDRSLTSPTYKRQQAMEQGNSSNFVPFVPFPPDYFAKKDDKQQSQNTDSAAKPTDKTSSPENSNNFARDANLVQDRATQVDNTVANSSSTQMNRTETSPESQTSNVVQQAPEYRSGWAGKSLEGSAVKETDPLDMSEEAKAERWFRRVAQIKDISELSQIPDEDFPSIMPMRKGVNRFVVSKRKTPLERRLTSPQYRKNLRTMSSDRIKKEGDGN